MQIILAKKIKEERVKLSLTQQQIADKIGIKRSKWASYEENRAKPKIEEMLKIAKLLSITMEELLTDEDITLGNEGLGSKIQRHGTGKVREPIVEEGAPLYNIKATAGLHEIFEDSHTHVPIGYITIPDMPRCHGAIYVHGESMAPLIQSGDIVVYRNVKVETSSFIWGEIYVLYFKHADEDIVTVKYVYKGDDGKHIKLVGHNRDDISHAGKDIPISDVRAAAAVKASIRRYTL